MELIRAEAERRTAALKAKLAEVRRSAYSSTAALGAAQAELASSRAELLLLQQRVDGAEAVARRNEDEIHQRQTLENEHAPMLQTLRERANAALGNICEVAVAEPHVINYAGNLQFFTDVVTQLETRSDRNRWLVEDRSRALLGRAFSRVFSYLQDRDPHIDFDAAIAPVPVAIRGDLAQWVEDNMDAVVRAFASDDDGVIVAANEGGVVDEPGIDGGGGGGGVMMSATPATPPEVPRKTR